MIREKTLDQQHRDIGLRHIYDMERGGLISSSEAETMRSRWTKRHP